MPGTKSKARGLFGDEDCERPACDDVKQALPKSMEELQAMAQKHAANKKVECPPRSAELGRSSWKLLHAMVCWSRAKNLVAFSRIDYSSFFSRHHAPLVRKTHRRPGTLTSQQWTNKRRWQASFRRWPCSILVFGVPRIFKKKSKRLRQRKSPSHYIEDWYTSTVHTCGNCWPVFILCWPSPIIPTPTTTKYWNSARPMFMAMRST